MHGTARHSSADDRHDKAATRRGRPSSCLALQEKDRRLTSIIAALKVPVTGCPEHTGGGPEGRPTAPHPTPPHAAGGPPTEDVGPAPAG